MSHWTGWQNRIRRNYERRDAVWPEGDSWHAYTRHVIRVFVDKETDRQPGKLCLLVGSGGIEYELCKYGRCIHLDIVPRHIMGRRLSAVGMAENMPFASASMDTVIAVGSVLNYTDPAKAIAEISRVLRPGGRAIVEAESSESLEYALKPAHFQPWAKTETFFGDEVEELGVISYKHLCRMLRANGLKPLKVRRLHVATPLLYRLFRRTKVGSQAIFVDRFLSAIPLLNRFAGNFILSCEKKQ